MIHQFRFSLAICLVVASSTLLEKFPHGHEMPLPGWTGPTFALSQNDAAPRPTNQAMRWKTPDFRTDPAGYLHAVLQYYMHQVRLAPPR